MFDPVANKTEWKAVRALSRHTFKRMCGLNQRTSINIVKILMGVDTARRAEEREITNSSRKEEMKKRNQRREGLENEIREEAIDLRAIPNTMIKTMNMLGKIECKG